MWKRSENFTYIGKSRKKRKTRKPALFYPVGTVEGKREERKPLFPSLGSHHKLNTVTMGAQHSPLYEAQNYIVILRPFAFYKGAV